MKKLILVLTVIGTFLNGCASFYISSQIDPEEDAPQKSQPIFIIIGESPSISERKFHVFLKDQMVINGFNIVEESTKAKYFMLFQLGEKTSKINSVLYMPSTSTTHGYAGGTYYSTRTRTSNPVPYSYDYTVKKIYLELYDIKELKKKKYITVWEGYLGAKDQDFDECLPEMLKELFDKFGKNFQGHREIEEMRF